jgi:hypothetical protein
LPSSLLLLAFLLLLVLFWRWHPATAGISGVAGAFLFSQTSLLLLGPSSGKESMLFLASYFSGVHAVAGALAVGSVPGGTGPVY